MEDQETYFDGRLTTRTYLSRVFQFPGDSHSVRNVQIVIDGCEEHRAGEIDSSLVLRTGKQKSRTQVTALVIQDDQRIRRLILETFVRSKDGDIHTKRELHKFTFKKDEFQRLVDFAESIEFLPMADKTTHSIEDKSSAGGRKVMIDRSHDDLLERVKDLDENERDALLRGLKGSLSREETNLLLGRRDGLTTFSEMLAQQSWSETEWQQFFEQNLWVFGYGLDYRVMGLFDREVTVGQSGTDNREKPTVDFLMTFTDYTALVEIKTPQTPLFKRRRSSGGRAGTWDLSNELISAVSQIHEQKAEWLISSASNDHWNKDGTEKLQARTRDAKSVLIIGNSESFEEGVSLREKEIRNDTFELFRQGLRHIDVIPFDELHDRARFIADGAPRPTIDREPSKATSQPTSGVNFELDEVIPF